MKETIKNMEKIVKGLNHANNLSNSNSYKSEEELISLIYSEDFYPSMLHLAKGVLKDLKDKENKMKTFKKTFYLKHHDTVEFTMESNIKIKQLRKYYYNLLRKGKIIIEKVGNESEIIIDLRGVDIIEIKEEKENENEKFKNIHK